MIDGARIRIGRPAAGGLSTSGSIVSRSVLGAAPWVLLIVVLVFAGPAAVQAEDHKAPLATLELEDGDSVVFLGDSITHQCLYTQYVENYFYTRFPSKRLTFHNAGVGGAKAWDALERFDRDVAAYKPKYVTVLLGMNDGRYQPYDEEIFRTYHRDMQTLIGRIREIGATPVLMTPTMYDSRAARMSNREHPSERLEFYNSVLSYFGTWLRETAVEQGYGFVDMFSLLNNLTLQERKADPGFTLIRDAVHPDAPGQLVMAYAIVADLDLPRVVSNIRITKTSSGKPNVRAVGGKLSDLRFTEDGLEFTWLADSLPWVVPEEARTGAKLLRLGHRASREALEVHGLPAGRYELTIDGDSVGTFTTAALARHIELQENEKTPQYAQARQVAELNKRRNDGPVKSLRNEWRVFQQHSRLKAELADAPNNRQLAAQFAEWEQRLAGLDERIERHRQAAREIEDRIFQVNRPQPRKYELKRADVERTVPVRGTVRFNAAPLANADVTFVPERGRPARGLTDAAGRFVLKTGQANGAAPGEYRVTIAADGVPARYSNREQTGLRAQIVEGSGNEFIFELRN